MKKSLSNQFVKKIKSILKIEKKKFVGLVLIFSLLTFFYSPGLVVAADTSAPTVTAPISTPQTLKSGGTSSSNVNINETGTVYMQKQNTGGLTTLLTADNLTGLTINGGTITGYSFVAGTKEYYNVYSSATSITVTPTGSGTITVNGTVVNSGSASASINLTSGTQTISVIVSQTGKMDNVYTLKVMNLATSNSGTVISSVPGYMIHKFTTVGSNTFSAPSAISGAEVLVVAGGGGGGAYSGGGGAGGGLQHYTGVSISSGNTSITVGAGGTAMANPSAGGTGGNSVFGAYTKTGGSGGATNWGKSGGNGCGGSGGGLAA